MLYEVGRDEIPDGSLVTCYTNTLQSQILRWYSALDVAHPETAIWMRNRYEDRWRLFTVGSVGYKGGVVPTPVSTLVRQCRYFGGKVYVHPLLDRSKAAPIVGSACSMLGSPYPKLHQHLLTGLLWLRWLRKRYLRLGPDIDPLAYHCWEANAKQYLDAGYNFGGKEACEVQLAEIIACPWFGPRYELQ